MKRINIVLIFFIGFFSAKSQEKPHQEYLNKYNTIFQQNYTIEKKEVVTNDQLTKNPYVEHFKNNSLQNISLIQFVSRKEISTNTKLRFRVMIYQYASNDAASQLFEKVGTVKTNQDESVFAKDWDYVVLGGNIIVRLDAGCLYSEAEWNKLKEQFLKVEITHKLLGTIECKCGGSCK